jgi:phosphoribosylformylglycinamidine cyclo-ligase
MSQDKHDAYAKAGVSYAAMDPSKILAQTAAAATASQLAKHGLSELSQSRGESAYVVDFGEFYVSTVTEALGTKNLVADAVRCYTNQSHYDTIAKDVVATILNDLTTLGGHPVCVTAYWGTGSSAWFEDAERMADLIDGWKKACIEAGASWGGGETQVLTSMIADSTVVLGGSAVGRIPKDKLLLSSQLEAGDVILIAPSSGIHANGLTLARQLANQLPTGYETVCGKTTYGEALLEPTPLYGKYVEALQAANIELHYTAHITGHGLRKIMRAPQEFTYVIEQLPQVPVIFEFMAQHLNMSKEESFGTFNMGAGFAFFVKESHAQKALDVARDRSLPLVRSGSIERGEKRVILKNEQLTFSGSTLSIR